MYQAIRVSREIAMIEVDTLDKFVALSKSIYCNFGYVNDIARMPGLFTILFDMVVPIKKGSQWLPDLWLLEQDSNL